MCNFPNKWYKTFWITIGTIISKENAHVGSLNLRPRGVMQTEIFKNGNNDGKKIMHQKVLNKKQHFLNFNTLFE